MTMNNNDLSIAELHELFFEHTDIAIMHFVLDGNDLRLINANKLAFEATQNLLQIGQKLCKALPAHRDFNADVEMPLIDWYLGAIASGEVRHRTFRFEDSVPGRLALYWENTTIPCGEYCMMKFRDVTEKEMEQQRLREEVNTDPLTQICNRRAFDIELKARCQGNEPFALMMLDLNKFKAVNDTYGHAFGDRLLTLVAQRLKESVRECDRPFRLAGDEFAVIVDGTQNLDQIAQRIDVAIQEAVKTNNNNTYYPQCSIGCVAYVSGDTFEDLYGFADESLYRAKRNGSDCNWWVCDRSQSYKVLYQELLNELDNPVNLQLHYQPIIHLETGAVSSYEALIRWNRPSGAIRPDVILDVVRHYRCEVRFCLWTISQAQRQWLAWGSPEQAIAVNCSPSWLQHEAIIQAFLAAKGIAVEVTEDELISKNLEVIDAIRWLSHAHVCVSVDDFGSGYAGFGSLEKVPVTGVKIDQELVQSSRLVSASAAFLEGLGLKVKVVAEGIDTQEKLDYCRKYVEFGQGYLFGKPMPGSEINPKSNSL